MKFSLHTVRLLILLLANFVLAATSVPSSFNKITRKFKTGVLDVEVVNKTVILSIQTNGTLSTRMKNVLYTKDPKSLKGPLLLGACGTNTICVVSDNVTYATIQTSPGTEVITVSRIVHNSEAELTDCYELVKGTQWFGGPERRYQYWPIQNMYIKEEPYLPTHPMNMAVSERYWLSSKGIYLFVNEKDPLFLDQNTYKAGHICLIAKNKAPYRRRQSISLNYEIGVYQDPRLAHQHVIKKHFGKPKGHPNERMIKHPIWSTWARYKANINEKLVEDFADEIIRYKFNNSQIEIDDNWETCYGSAIFDTTKFPNITDLVSRLKKKGFKVTLWIHPFINERCEPAYSFALKNNYFVKSTDGKVHMSWWQGRDAATIDFTNPKAVQWWVARLKRLQQSGIDSFKFDAGEASWLPEIASLTGALDMQPGIFTLDYVNALAKNFDDSIEARVGWRSQNLSIFIRMIDKDTHWTWNNGLPTLITTLLQMNLNGYVYVLPDMIGGNGYVNGQLNSTEYPPKELFIRWLQTNVFMPSLQYSFAPWDYDNETIAISRKFTDLHAQITPIIVNLMKETIATGAPINPPIWWVDPTNPVAHQINDEYLLGDEILVAPVIKQGAVKRNIYLPTGRWKDAKTNQIHIGRKWLYNYPAPLDTLPYFIRQ